MRRVEVANQVPEKGVFQRVATNNPKPADSKQIESWAAIAAQAADDKKAIDPVILRVGEVLAITDAFVIVSGSNERQVKAIVDEVEKQIKEAGGPSPRRIEGLNEGRWVLMDYGDFVVHAFLDEIREYYDLERLWSDAPRLEWSNESNKAAAGR